MGVVVVVSGTHVYIYFINEFLTPSPSPNRPWSQSPGNSSDSEELVLPAQCWGQSQEPAPGSLWDVPRGAQ